MKKVITLLSLLGSLGSSDSVIKMDESKLVLNIDNTLESRRLKVKLPEIKGACIMRIKRESDEYPVILDFSQHPLVNSDEVELEVGQPITLMLSSKGNLSLTKTWHRV